MGWLRMPVRRRVRVEVRREGAIEIAPRRVRSRSAAAERSWDMGLGNDGRMNSVFK